MTKLSEMDNRLGYTDLLLINLLSRSMWNKLYLSELHLALSSRVEIACGISGNFYVRNLMTPVQMD